MTGKRKRHRPAKSVAVPSKRLRKDGTGPVSSNAAVTHPTLSLYYPRIQTLRDFVLEKLPASSKKRRRKIAAVNCHENVVKVRCERKPQINSDSTFDHDAMLAKLLDRTLVCVRHDEPRIEVKARELDWNLFSQKREGVDESSMLESGTPQSEVSCFVAAARWIVYFLPLAVVFIFFWLPILGDLIWKPCGVY